MFEVLECCAPQKVDPALIARCRPAMVGCFQPIFFFTDHRILPLCCDIAQGQPDQFCGGTDTSTTQTEMRAFSRSESPCSSFHLMSSAFSGVPIRALGRAAPFGVTKPEHEVDSEALRPGIACVLDDQLLPDRRP